MASTAARPRVLVTRIIPEQGLNLVREQCDAEIWPELLPPSRDRLLSMVPGVEGILSMFNDPMDAATMEAAGPQLRVISNCAVGYDNVAVAEATRRGVAVGNTPGILTETTADMAFALLLAAARRVVEGDRFVRDGKWLTWEPMGLLGQDLHGATLGLIGFGRIGQAVARRARGFNMRILYHDPGAVSLETGDGVEKVELEELLRRSDFISLHVPLTPETRGLINARTLALMKRTAVLVNTSRGPIVDASALSEALGAGNIRAALDVTDPEPVPTDSPLLRLDNLIITPHIGSASVATRGRMAQMAAENLLAGLRGERLPHCVNPEVYSR